MKKSISVAIMVIVLLLLASCGKDEVLNAFKADVESNIVGTWLYVADTHEGENLFDDSDACFLQSTYVYNSDGSYHFKHYLTDPNGECRIFEEYRGNYEFPYTDDGPVITMVMHPLGEQEHETIWAPSDGLDDVSIDGDTMIIYDYYADGSTREKFYKKQ